MYLFAWTLVDRARISAALLWRW